MSLPQKPLQPRVDAINGSYFVLYSNSLQVKGKTLGQLFVAQDITAIKPCFLAVVWSLGISSLLSVGAMTVVIALYIQRLCNPTAAESVGWNDCSRGLR
jgi:hypothetical protein